MEPSDSTSLELIDTKTIKRFFGLLRQFAWLLLLGILLGTAGGYLISRLQKPIYRATARVLVFRPAGQSQVTDPNATLTSQQFMQTYVLMFKLGPVVDAVEKQLNINISPDEISASIVQNTQYIDIRVDDQSAQQATKIASALVQVVVKQNDSLQGNRYASAEKSLDEQITLVQGQLQAAQTKVDNNPTDAVAVQSLQVYQQIYANLLTSRETLRLARLENAPDIVQIGKASASSTPIRPNPRTNTLLGGVAGLILALTIVILVDFLDDTLKNGDDVKRSLGLNVLGLIAEAKGRADGLHVANQSRSPVSEAFRSLRTNLEYLAVDSPIQTILITSSAPGEGKSWVAANLAGILAQSGKKVLLIDADFRRPSLHRLLGMGNRYGLSDLFLGRKTLDEAIQTFQGEAGTEFGLLTTGALPPNPAELLASDRMRAILAEACQRADLIILDTPPSLVADAEVLATRVDGSLFVVQTGKTHAEAAQAVVEALRASNARLLGAILNRIQRRHMRSGGFGNMSYRYYGQYLAEGRTAEKPAAKKRLFSKEPEKKEQE